MSYHGIVDHKDPNANIYKQFELTIHEIFLIYTIVLILFSLCKNGEKETKLKRVELAGIKTASHTINLRRNPNFKSKKIQ